ncbi:peptidoglycan-binding protein [Alkalihalobacillus sp. BA299]|uniref:peptidoglycan-binding protein n=1 Tax=Alkalihalobacillus sp. BA299 TaxID=2815938 RepID=UPI0024694F7E|nr:peptidoglycan-binding protein [Alkalihalobacillus sp. BA299]
MQARNSQNALGLDVSHHQGSIDWPKVKAAGKSFVFIKVTEGVGFIDPKFHENYVAAKKEGFIVGAYHYATPAIDDAIEEADYFVDTLLKFNALQKGDLPPVLDLEEHRGLNKDELTNWARNWINRVKERIGIEPIIYSYPWFIDTHLHPTLHDIPLWFARYGVNQPRDYGGWNRWTFLQYTASGSVNGINGPVDLNEFDGTVEDLKEFVSLATQNLKLPTSITITLELLLEKSKSYFDNLHPVVRDKAIQLITEGYKQKINGVIISGFRSIEKQNELYEQGRSKPGNIVTNAPGGHSYHNYGLAVDIGILNPDGKSFNWNDLNAFKQLGQIGVSLGFEWGGNWRTFKDYPHFQYTFGLSIKDLLSGKRPPDHPFLQEGDKGEEVEKLQTYLKKLGFYKGSIDGIFGPVTKEAVKAFQKSQGLTVDGIVGSNTREALKKALSTPQPKPSPEKKNLERGAQGEEVKSLQTTLKKLGYYKGTIDGIFGPVTEQAVKAFQKSKGLTVDGIVGPNTREALSTAQPKPSPEKKNLKRGAQGEEVKSLQTRLKKLGYYKGTIDGIFGPVTEQAVKAFQKSKGLTVDGIVGPNTREALNKK